MTIIYHAVLELHDSLYFATREIGRLYETEPVLHNYALSYVLGLVDNPQFNTTVKDEEYSYRYFCEEQVPRYEEHLTPLNEQGIYVTPAIALHYSSILNTWKYADNHYHVEMQQMETNTPGFGRTKEISPESQFEFFVLAQNPLTINRWLRIGKWASKAKIEKFKPLKNLQIHQASEFTYRAPLNPLDVMFANQVLSYDTLNMPPVSLITNVRIIGDYYTSEDYPGLKLPARMQYSFGG
jgi:CRISPR-associated protein Csc1